MAWAAPKADHRASSSSPWSAMIRPSRSAAVMYAMTEMTAGGQPGGGDLTLGRLRGVGCVAPVPDIVRAVVLPLHNLLGLCECVLPFLLGVGVLRVLRDVRSEVFLLTEEFGDGEYAADYAGHVLLFVEPLGQNPRSISDSGRQGDGRDPKLAGGDSHAVLWHVRVLLLLAFPLGFSVGFVLSVPAWAGQP